MPKLGAFLLQYGPAYARACATCFSGSDTSDLSKAFYLGGALLLACTFGLVGGLVYAIVRLERRREERDRAAGLYPDGGAA